MRHARRRRRRHAHALGGLAPQGRFFRSGELRLALLALLAEGPRHGYELMVQLEERSGGLYRASAGSVYPTLQQLEDEDLARSHRQDGKRVYELSEAGHAEVAECQEAIGTIWRRAEEWGEWRYASSPESWEIARPLASLGKTALRAVTRRGDDPEVVEEVRRILREARKAIADLDR